VRPDWVQWVDAPGWGAVAGTALDATQWYSASIRLAVEVRAEGTDGKSVTASFKTGAYVVSKNGKWEVANNPDGTPIRYGPQPPLGSEGATWGERGLIQG